MRGYDRDELQDYDDYDDYEDGEQEGGEEYQEEGEEEYEEEEPRKPTEEELDYLKLRQKLKESIRKQMKKESSTSLADSSARGKKLPYDNYGSFFGPSQPVIAQRVIQESRSLLENQHLTSRLINSTHNNNKMNKTNKVSNGGSKPSAHNRPPKVSENRVRAQKLKDTRDYSFLLSDDAEVPAPSKAPPSQNGSVRNSDERPAQFAGKSKQPLVNGGKLVRGSSEEQKLVSGAGRLPPKSGSNNKLNSASKASNVSRDSRKQFESNSGNGPGRPVGPKVLPSKMPASTVGSKSLTPGMKNPVNGVNHPLPPKVPSSVPKHSVEQRKDVREQNKPKLVPKQPMASSKAQINKPLKQNPKHSDLQDHRPKNKVGKRHFDDDVEDEMDVSRMIRSMFNYNPNRFVDDDDDDDMEAGFDEIMKEERRSAKIAKKEDEEQLRLIEEEEERERRRRLAKLKKRKVGE